MEKIERLSSVAQFNTKRGQETLHPLVSLLDQSKSKLIQSNRFISELYIVFLKDVKCGPMTYGRSHYDYEDETLIFIAPGQVYGIDLSAETLVQPKGWTLVFHPDFIKGTSLSKQMKEYGFFSYDSNEALHLSARERQIVLECFRKIKDELEHGIDKYSKTLIISNIELFLNYCTRFYGRQFITRENINKNILVKFEELLTDYFQSDKPQIIGLPSVAYCAEQLNLSANYFGDLIKKETGKSAQEYIHSKVIDLAKEKIIDISKSISEVSYEMGFKYPPHFTRLFKQWVGQSPTQYRIAN
ncbi:AraC family transcriptional regulator [Emticicia sp. C21]|uniref:helix-turn-helix domain-containing protein n=1 Tax=Emticicia sp. C21 TaxID=2302915 RepID=UPI000E34B039|nr:helix-turn-helix domain-containing protein [Emticicia sp. C21]RFS17737.1 AraC family transcriptional regulator [Emticicia sp. C21]